jgi:hypothetical protein
LLNAPNPSLGSSSNTSRPALMPPSRTARASAAESTTSARAVLMKEEPGFMRSRIELFTNCRVSGVSAR